MQSHKDLSYKLSGFLITLLLVILYSNTLNSPWILDDFHNIVNNSKIQIIDLTFQSIKGAFFSKVGNSEQTYRPLSCLSFALNAYISGKNVFGYHLFNIGLHAINTIMLLWLMVQIFSTPALVKTATKEKHFIIVLATLLWVINPIQIQAITYIVQRMAMLCTFFSILAFVAFIKARTVDLQWKKVAYSLSCIFFTICAFLSKENGLVIIPLLLVLEFFLFQNGDYQNLLNRNFALSLVAVITVLLLAFFFTTSTSLLQELYERRPFTLYERLITQPKIILFYLSLILYPLPHRFSLEHEVVISTGLFSPTMTIFYLALVGATFWICFFYQKIPFLVRIAVLFFLIGHSVESSFLPLEMIFEHRNYLPSLFLFLPVAAGFYQLINRYRSSSKFMVGMLVFFITGLIFLVGMATYTRNLDWRSDRLLWMDAMEKAPKNARPKQSMGLVYGMQHPEKALSYYFKSLEGYMHEPVEEKASALTNIGLIFFHQQKYESAQNFFEKALKFNDKYTIARYFLIQTFMKQKQWEEALSISEIKNSSPNLKYLQGICFLRMEKHEPALEIFRNLYKNDRNNKNALLGIAEVLSMKRHYRKAEFFYNFFMAQYQEKYDLEIAYIGAAKNSYLMGDIQKAVLFLEKFFKMVGIENTSAYLHMQRNDIFSPLSGLDEFSLFIEKRFYNYKKQIQFNHFE